MIRYVHCLCRNNTTECEEGERGGRRCDGSVIPVEGGGRFAAKRGP